MMAEHDELITPGNSPPVGVPVPTGFDDPRGVPLRDISMDEGGLLISSIEGIASAARGLGTGFNKELATILGIPGTLVNTAADLMGMNAEGYIAAPKDIERLLNTLGISTTVDNQDQLGRIASGIGKGLAMTLPFAVGGVALAGREALGPFASILAEPFKKAVGTAVTADLLSGVGVGAVDAVLNEMEIDNHLLRFGIEFVVGMIPPLSLARSISRAGKMLPAQNIDGPFPSHFEIARMRAEDKILAELKDVENAGRFVDDAVEVFRADLDRIDPDGVRWPLEVREQLVEQFKVKATKGKGPTGPRGDIGKEAKRVDSFLLKSQETRDKVEAGATKKAISMLERGWFDRSAGVRAQLVNKLGPAGQKAEMYFALQAGSPRWADHLMSKAREATYRGFTKSERDVFDRYLTNRRLKEILVSRGSKTKLPSGNLQAYEKVEKDLLDGVGADRAAIFRERGDQYFEHMRAPLRSMLDNGLISEKEFVKLSRFDYQPTKSASAAEEFLNALDPNIKISSGGRLISVPSSGIKPMGHEVRDLLLTDSEVLLSQVYARSYGRIARNRANLELLNVARTVPDNSVVRLKRPKEGGREWTRLSTMEGGKERKFWMSNEYVDQWVSSSSAVDDGIAQTLRVISGADILRTFATGAGNPEFALVNLARDWFHAWASPNEMFGPVYSAFTPKGFSQLAKDLAMVLPDVLRMEGRAIDYLREGGGMAFMTQGAREIGLKAARRTQFDDVVDMLSIVNSRSELWTRLAIRERALRNGMTPEEATYTARTWIDFHQGGTSSKFLDNFMPYLNASLQGFRGTTRAAQQNPAKFAAKIVQAMGAVTGLWAYNRMTHPEAMDQIDERVQANNFIFPLPGYYLDALGNKRYRYMKIPVEHSFLPFKGVADAMMARAMPLIGEPKAKIPKRELIESFANSIPLIGDPIQTGSIPSIRFLMALSNFDMWLKDDVWRGPEGLPLSQEFREFPNRPTPPIAVDVTRLIAERTGLQLSPERWSSALGAVVPRNMYTTMASAVYNKYTNGFWQPEGESADLLPREVIKSRLPFARRAMGTSSPYANIEEETQEIASVPKGEVFAKTREADSRIARIMSPKTPLSQRGRLENSYEDWVSSVGEEFPEMRKRLTNRLVIARHMGEVFNRLELPSSLPPRTWWLNRVGNSPVERAVIFHAFELKLGTSTDRAAFNNVAKRIPGFVTPEFIQVLKRERQKSVGGPTNMIR